MTTNRPWYQLELDVSYAIRADLDFDLMLSQSQYRDQSGGIWHFRDREVTELLNRDWISAMHDLGIPVLNAMVFYRKPFYIHPEAHIDVKWNGAPCISAINWTLDINDDSEMTWYDIPELKATDAITPAGTRYVSWPMQQIESWQIDSKIIGVTPTLVNTGIPHNVIVRSRPRWAISVRCQDKHLQTWADSVKFFEPWIKHVDSQP